MALAEHSILAFGASHLTFVRVSRSSVGLVLEQVVRQPLQEDSSQKDRWLECVLPALGQLAHKTSLKSVASVVLPGWAVLSKTLTVARIEGEGQEEVVRFEFENSMPDGLDDYEWTYRILTDDGFERGVLVQAVSSEFLASFLKTLSDHQINPSRVDASLSCQLQAYSEQYGKEEETSVLLDVGSRSASLIVASPDELPFVRTFNFGGSLVTQSLADRTGKSFPEAERMKMEVVENQGDSGSLEMLNQCSEGFVTRLVNEVQRSLALYRRQGKAGTPQRILLSGGASQLPGLVDFLERKTGVACSFYDPFRTLTSGLGLATAQTTRMSFALVAPVGMAWSSLAEIPNQANLLPGRVSAQYATSEKRPWWLAAASLLLLSILLVGLKYHYQAWDLQSEVTRLEAELAPLESLSKNVNRAHEEYLWLTNQAKAKVAMIEEQAYWVAFLSDIQNRLNQVQDVWLESMAPDIQESQEDSLRMRVRGSLLDRENPLSLVSSNARSRVEALLGSFENSPFIRTVEDRRFDTSRPGILQFDFALIVEPKGDR